MPCYDPRDSAQYIEKHEVRPLERRVAKLEAMLCAILTKYEGPEYNNAGIATLLDGINTKEAGITRGDILEFWSHHKAEDERRRKRVVALRNKQRAMDEQRLIDLANKLGKKVV